MPGCAKNDAALSSYGGFWFIMVTLLSLGSNFGRSFGSFIVFTSSNVEGVLRVVTLVTGGTSSLRSVVDGGNFTTGVKAT